jgi:hypothetical protein
MASVLLTVADARGQAEVEGEVFQLKVQCFRLGRLESCRRSGERFFRSGAGAVLYLGAARVWEGSFWGVSRRS